jgi:hypothetical protein
VSKIREKSAANTAVWQPRKSARKPTASRGRQKQIAAPTEHTSAAAAAPAAPVRQTKKGSILTLLQRPKGAAISELTAATGWQVHSVRAALTGLRKEGKELVRDKDQAGVTLYRIAEEG